MDQATETGCCPRFDPLPWDDKEFRWEDKLFVRDRVRSFLHIPLNFGAVMKRNMKVIEAAQAECSEVIVLSDDNSLWGADVYVAVSKEIPGARMERITGTFLARAFEGPYRMIGQWVREMKATLQERNWPFQKLLFWYTTCPRCAKAYGKNYVVLLAQK